MPPEVGEADAENARSVTWDVGDVGDDMDTIPLKESGVIISCSICNNEAHGVILRSSSLIRSVFSPFDIRTLFPVCSVCSVCSVCYFFESRPKSRKHRAYIDTS